MKKLFLLLFVVFMPVTFVLADDFVPSDEEDLSISANVFTLDADNSGGNISLRFGETLAETLFWDSANSRFALSTDLQLSGEFSQTGNSIMLDSDNTLLGNDVSIIANQGTDNAGVIRYNSTSNQWEISNDGGSFDVVSTGSGSGIAPYIESIVGGSLVPNTSGTIAITGGNFDYNTTVDIPGWPGTIDQVRYLSDENIEIDVTTANTQSVYSLTLFNGVLSSTDFDQNVGQDAIEVATPQWLDLRLGGDTFTHGNGTGNDIRYRTGMNLIRNSNGMYFTGSNVWSSWVKFEGEQFARVGNTTTEWIFRTDGPIMVGISGINTDENSNSQWQQGAVMGYFQSATQQWGYYGSSPNSGSTWSQNDSITFGTGAILKLKIENDGSNGQMLTLYQLPSANPADWDDETTILNTTISTNNNTQTPLVPFIIPRSSSNNYFVALKVQ